MEGKGPYRIYDPGGSEVKARDEAGGGSSYRQLLEENSILRERMKGLKSLGRFLKRMVTSRRWIELLFGIKHLLCVLTPEECIFPSYDVFHNLLNLLISKTLYKCMKETFIQMRWNLVKPDDLHWQFVCMPVM